jgi:hypothetical protein
MNFLAREIDKGEVAVSRQTQGSDGIVLLDRPKQDRLLEVDPCEDAGKEAHRNS